MSKSVGKIPSGLYIVTTNHDNKPYGFLGSWIQQASFEPLMVTVAVDSGSRFHTSMQTNKKFCINILGENSDNELFRLFSKGWNFDLMEKDEEEAVTSQYILSKDESGVILKNCLGVLKCESVSSFKTGDHEIVSAEVLESIMVDEDDKPKIHVRNNGSHY